MSPTGFGRKSIAPIPMVAGNGKPPLSNHRDMGSSCGIIEPCGRIG